MQGLRKRTGLAATHDTALPAQGKGQNFPACVRLISVYCPCSDHYSALVAHHESVYMP